MGNETLVDDSAAETKRTFDDLGQLTVETVNPEGESEAADASVEHEYEAPGAETQTTGDEGTTATATYDLAGRVLAQQTGQTGHAAWTTSTYDPLGRVLTTTDPVATTTNTYDRTGRLLTSVRAGQTTTHIYDRAGNQLTVTAPDATVTTTTYDPLDRPTVVIANDVSTPSGPTEDITTTTYYDAAGQVIATKDPQGISSRTIPNVRGLAATTIAACTDSGTTPTSDPPACTGGGTHTETTNVVTTATYDGAGATLSSVTDFGTGEGPATTSVAYDAAGREVARKDPRGTVTRTLYNAAGQRTAVIVNCTTSGTTLPDPWAGCTGAGTANGSWNVATTYAYDARGNLASETAPNGRVTSYRYDQENRLVERIDNDVAGSPGPLEDLTTTTYYDAAGRVVATKVPTVNRTTFRVDRTYYNITGEILYEVQNCTDSGTTLPEDPASCIGNSGTQDAETNLKVFYLHNAKGLLRYRSEPDPIGSGYVETLYAYDAANRLCRVLENASIFTLETLGTPCSTTVSGDEATNVSTRYLYDDAGNLTSMIDGRGTTTTYGYDARGNLTSLTDGLTNTVLYGYDELGRKTSQTNRSDLTPLTPSITWLYDGAGRLIERTSAETATVTYEYDANGNLTLADDGSSSISATYDRLNRPTLVDDGTNETTYDYTDLDAPEWTDPTGAYVAELDPFGRQIGLTDPLEKPWGFDYRADGAPDGAANGDGTSTLFTYDNVGRLESKETDAGDVAAYAWAYNRAGVVTSETSSVDGDPGNGMTTFTYDNLGRLATYERDSVETEYGWQAVPNRVSLTVGEDDPIETTFDAANRPTGGDYGSDEDGRLLTRTGQNLAWDDLGRLIEVNNGFNTINEYLYDPLDRLVYVGGTAGSDLELAYVGLTKQIATITDNTAGSTTYLVNGWDGARLASWTPDGELDHYGVLGTNAHHDITYLTDDAGEVASTARYDPWGRITDQTGDLLRFGFQGSFFDHDTELSWVITRWYAPAEGRFISEDSLLGDPIDPPSRHLLAYGAGDPVNYWDPDGRMPARVAQPCSVAALTCSVAQFDRMTAGQRWTWMRSFQTQWRTKGWFNAIEGVLNFARIHKDAIVPGKSWSSLVDAYILAAIQDGKRLEVGKSILVAVLKSSSSIWKSFFVALRRDTSVQVLNSAWGRAEQRATDIAVAKTKAAGRRPKIAEIAMKVITDNWRGSLIENRPTIAYMTPLCKVAPTLLAGNIASSALSGGCFVAHEGLRYVADPRKSTEITVLATGLWGALGWLP
jgi:RHS repeat-associated protein